MENIDEKVIQKKKQAKRTCGGERVLAAQLVGEQAPPDRAEKRTACKTSGEPPDLRQRQLQRTVRLLCYRWKHVANSQD